MQRYGHWGAALLAYAPVGAALLAGSFEGVAVAGGASVLALARLPDVDVRIPFVTHRGSTHTVTFALLVGLCCGAAVLALGRSLASTRGVALGAFGFLVGALAIGSHLLADVITPAGIAPFWPLSSERYSADLVRADSLVGNYALLTLGVCVSIGLLVLARSL